MTIKDETNNTYGKLTVLGLSAKRMYNQAAWLCKCECGNESIVCGQSLRRGATTSCGCVGEENKKIRATTHGKTRTPSHITWTNMLQRCQDPNKSNYRYYGGRGIKVCDRWLDFENFYEDMGDRPKDKTLDRKDNDGDYSPENCKWSTKKEQSLNTSQVHLIEFNGIADSISGWGRRLGISSSCMWHRLKRLPLDRALTESRGF